MYYDEDDMLRAAGATAALDSIKDEAEFEGWLKVELYVHRFSDLPFLLTSYVKIQNALKAAGHNHQHKRADTK